MDSTLTADWLNVAISVMQMSQHIGADIYPFLAAMGLIRSIILVV